MRSAYHVRELEVHRLLRLAQPLDVFLSHDWPQGIARHGDLRRLLQRKSFLRREVGHRGGCCVQKLPRRLHPALVVGFAEQLPFPHAVPTHPLLCLCAPADR